MELFYRIYSLTEEFTHIFFLQCYHWLNNEKIMLRIPKVYSYTSRTIDKCPDTLFGSNYSLQSLFILIF